MLGGWAMRALQPFVALGMETAEPEAFVAPYFEPPLTEAYEEAQWALESAGIAPRAEVDLLFVVNFDRPSYERRLGVYEQCVAEHPGGGDQKFMICNLQS